MTKRTKGRANGEGSVYEYPKDSGVWYAEVSLLDGTRRKRRASSQRVAREKLKQLQAEIEQGVDLKIEQPTVAEWCMTWLTTFATNLKPSIRDNYHDIIQKHIVRAAIGRRPLDKLTVADVQRWVNQLAKTVKPKTVQNTHARLRRALEVAVRNDYIARNVASRVELPPVPKPAIFPLDVPQVQVLLRAVATHRWFALYRLAVNLGMREGELFGLTWPAIDLEKGTLRIFQQLQRARKDGRLDGPREFILQTTKTKSGERTLRIDADLIAVLCEHKRLQDEERALLGDQWRDPWGNLVFTTETGAPIHSGQLRWHFHRVLKQAQLPRIRFHDLRHTAATLMLANNVPIVTVSKILGHVSPAITAAIYAHALDDSKSAAIADLSQQLRQPQ